MDRRPVRGEVVCLFLLLFCTACSQFNVQSKPVTITPSYVPGVEATFAAPLAKAIIQPSNAKGMNLSAEIPIFGTSSFAWLPGGDLVVAGGAEITFLELAIPKTPGQAEFFNQIGRQTAAAMPANLTAAPERYLAWSAADRKVHLWDLREKRSLIDLEMSEAEVTGIAFGPAGAQSHLAAADFNHLLRVWDPSTGSLIREWQSDAWLTNLSISPDGKRLAGVDPASFKVHQYDLETGAVMPEIQWSGNASPVLYGAYFSPDWEWIAWVARGAVQLMDLPGGEIGALLNHEDFVNAVAWSPDGRLIVTAAAGTVDSVFTPVVFIWDPKDGALIRTIPMAEGISSLSFSPDGRELAVLSSNGTLKVYSVYQ